MTSIQEVVKFLSDFHEKMQIFDIIFMDNRGKNLQALIDLELVPNQRLTIIESLTYKNYSQGPLNNTQNNYGDLWVFGLNVNKREVYVKIAMGNTNFPTICISFHIAEYPMIYPFN